MAERIDTPRIGAATLADGFRELGRLAKDTNIGEIGSLARVHEEDVNRGKGLARGCPDFKNVCNFCSEAEIPISERQCPLCTLGGRQG